MKDYLKLFFRNYFRSDFLFYAGLIIIAVGLPLSKFLMSVGQMVILLSWLLLGNYKQLVINFYNNKTALAVSSLFLLHILGLIYTTDFDYAMKDIRVKLPIFLLPFFFSSFKPLSLNKFKWLFYIFSVAVIFTTLIGLTRYFGLLGYQLIDKREVSVFISHIRFSLLIVVSIVSLFYFYKFESKTNKILILISIIWLSFFMFFMGFITGIVTLILFVVVYFLKVAFSKQNNQKWKVVALFLSILMASTYFIYYFLNEYKRVNTHKQENVLAYSKKGEKYFHDFEGMHKNAVENGYLIYRNIAWKELEQTWNSRSKIKFEEKDFNNQQIKNTLLRYLTSKGLNKDAEGVMALTNDDVKAIENGVANANYLKQSAVKTRINQIIWEIDNYIKGRDFNGHSIIMRWVYWQIGLDIIKENLLFGIGTGDVQNTYQEKYEKKKSILLPQFRLRAHNQFLTFTITFGIIGFFVFLFALFYPIFKLKLHKRMLYLAFFVVLFASFFTEDTLESQAGVTFYIFMHSVLCWLYPSELLNER